MSICIIFGGTGYIGLKWAAYLAQTRRFEKIILADINPLKEKMDDSIQFVLCDIRKPIAEQIGNIQTEWIFNFAALCREPGSEFEEYFDTNFQGARHVCEYATLTGCTQIFFTSSMATYGPTPYPKDEKSPQYPRRPYGISKLCAELVHEAWLKENSSRRLITCRPGVIYGPDDPGNILRMIRAIKRGYFFFPGSLNVHKSYGYIYGLLESFEFTMQRKESYLIYNYAEKETETVGVLGKIIKIFVRSKAPIISLPLPLLIFAASIIQVLTCGRSPIHPVRVRKVATSTHIVPQTLLDMGFPFKYDFRSSLEHWKTISPEDFN